MYVIGVEHEIENGYGEWRICQKDNNPTNRPITYFRVKLTCKYNVPSYELLLSMLLCVHEHFFVSYFK